MKRGGGVTVLKRTSEPEVEPWSEHKIAAAMARQTFQRKSIVLVPNCNWTGHECDLLVVTKDLRIIDVEVKISRSDLKADAKKEKWWHRTLAGHDETRDENGRLRTRRPIYDSHARIWPPRVWKHYYALPADIWSDELLDCLPSPASGVITLWDSKTKNHFGGQYVATVVRRAKPARDARRLDAAQAVDVARLANLRLWDAYAQRDSALREARKMREEMELVP